MTILIADAVISIAVQLSDALHTLAGGVAFALPALAFLALTKLVLSRSRTATEKEDSECAVQPASANSAPNQIPAPTANGAPATATGTTSPTAPSSEDSSSSPDVPVLTASPSSSLQPVAPAQLLASARMTAFAYQQATGRPITASEISARLGIPPALAESLLDRTDGTPSPVTEVNGIVMNGSRP
jgi:hypothetical protein